MTNETISATIVDSVGFIIRDNAWKKEELDKFLARGWKIKESN